MIVTTTESIPGVQYEIIGMVKGSTVQTVNAIRDIGASFKTIVGGEIKKYNEMVSNARDLAMQRMLDEAARYGADAVVGIRFGTSSIMQGAAEVMVYGTAVKFRR